VTVLRTPKHRTISRRRVTTFRPFPLHTFQVLLMAKEDDGRRREGWSHACQTRCGKGIVGASSSSSAYWGKRASRPSGHHARTSFAHIAFDEHAKIRHCPGRHTALVKNPAVLRGREVWLRL